MPLWLELCYVVNPAGKGGCKSKYPSSLFIWRQQRRKELVMCVKPASLVLSQTLLSVLGVCRNLPSNQILPGNLFGEADESGVLWLR